MNSRQIRHVHEQGHSVSARREDRGVINGAEVLGTRVSLVLDAVESLGSLPTEHVDAAADWPIITSFLLSAVTRGVQDGCHDK